MNKKRFPDFKGMIAVYHRAGMKIATNIKPCSFLLASLEFVLNESRRRTRDPSRLQTPPFR